ncbi:MAG TPA: RidA family protein [Candidatus Dormibacteraeota bacterium]|nr:RidA family protein [Candidatus Dormibacteraeota bacterium]
MDAVESPGGFKFLPTDGPYSAGVMANAGFAIVRVMAPRHTPLDQGFRLVEQTLREVDRPLAALCAMELRIPKPLSRAGFDEFNRGYIAQFERWGIKVDGRMPAARTNVAPELDPPAEPSLHAFCFTAKVPLVVSRNTFVIAGVAEPPGTTGGPAACWNAIAPLVEERMQSLGVTWDDATESQFYGTRADHEVFTSTDLARLKELTGPGLRWFFARPPIDDLRLEIDVRGLARESWA